MENQTCYPAKERESCFILGKKKRESPYIYVKS